MLEHIMVFGMIFYFFGLFFSGVLAFAERPFIKATWLFVLSNSVAFFSSMLYFVAFFGQNVALGNFDWFFYFSPRITPLSAIFFALISGISAVVGVYSVRYLALYEKSYSPHIVQSLMAFFVLGMQGVVVSNNAFVFIFFWEVMSITSFFLVLTDRSHQSISAAFLYFIMTHLGASAILGGFLILGHGTFFLDMDALRTASQTLPQAWRNMAFILFIFGFGSKAGLVPFHVWLPEAHPQAPSNISALMSGLMLKVAVYGFIMVMLAMHDVSPWVGIVVVFLGLWSSVVGVLYAVVEKDMKRAFAYSSIENMGIIFTMCGLAVYFFAHNGSHAASLIAISITAFAVLHAMSHACFKTALFLGSGVIINRTHTKNLNAMGGLAKVMPLFSGAFLLAALSALPIPPFSTFYGEWGLIQNLIASMQEMITVPYAIIILLITLAIVGLVSGLAIFAMVRIFSISMLGLPHCATMEKRSEKTDLLLIVPMWVLGGMVFLCGFFAKPIMTTFHTTITMMEDQPSIITVGTPMPHMAPAIGVLCVLSISVGIFLREWIGKKNSKSRTYHTWDCGQPIDATMQYSATAFSAPIRFFFLTFIGRKKVMTSKPVLSSNPWIVKNTFKLSISPKWSDMVYAPIAKSLLFVAHHVRVIQGGRIQYYVLFLLCALILTLLFAL